MERCKGQRLTQSNEQFCDYIVYWICLYSVAANTSPNIEQCRKLPCCNKSNLSWSIFDKENSLQAVFGDFDQTQGHHWTDNLTYYQYTIQTDCREMTVKKHFKVFKVTMTQKFQRPIYLGIHLSMFSRTYINHSDSLKLDISRRKLRINLLSSGLEKFVTRKFS